MRKVYILLLLMHFALPEAIAISCTGTNDVGGNVFRDYNFEGTQDQTFENGVQDILVIAYDVNGTIVDSIRTDANGDYALTVPNGTEVRIEFSDIPSYLQASRFALSSQSTVQFTTSPDCTINLVLNNPSDCYPPTDTLQLATPCYVSGDPLDPSGTAKDGDAFAVWSYDYSGGCCDDYLDLFGYPEGPAPNTVVTTDSVGALWGVAYDRTDELIFSSAVLRRHVGYGMLGTGGIYTIDPLTGAVDNWLDINTLSGVNTGADPRTDLTQPLVGGVVLPGDATGDSYDSLAYTLIGEIGIGDIDISTDDNTLFVTNLNEKTLVAVDIDSKTLDNVYAIPDPGCSNGDYRPWAVKVHDGEVYVGIVCSAETSQDSLHLRAYVYKMPETGGTFTPVLIDGVNGFSLNFDRDNIRIGVNGYWRPWTDVWQELSYPQPILSDIEFDVDGSMLLGFVDRYGLSSGFNNYGISPIEHGTTHYDGTSAGDILRVCYNNSNFYLEGGANCSSNILNNQGPNEGEYYHGEAYVEGNIHSETSFGGLALVPGTGEVVLTSMDPLIRQTSGTSLLASIFSGGVIYLDNTTGEQDTTKAYQLYNSDRLFGDDDYTTEGKAVGLGDLEALGHAVPIEIGNYVWIDADADGIQDPGEAPIEGAAVNIYDASGVLIATTYTDANGEYYFSSDDGLEYNTTYYITVGTVTGTNGVGLYNPTSGLDINGVDYMLTVDSTGVGTDPTLNDSDGEVNDGSVGPAVIHGSPYTLVTTGSTGYVDHSLDFGFFACPEITTTANDSICSGESVASLAVTATVTDSVQFVYFSSEQTDSTIIYSSGTSIDTVAVATNTATVTNVALPANNGTTDVTYYIYAIAYPTPGPTDCRPYAEIPVVVHPIPELTDTTIVLCGTAPVNIDLTTYQTAVTTATDGTFTWYSDATAATMVPDATAASVSNGDAFYVIYQDNTTTCQDTASVTFTINPLPTLTDLTPEICGTAPVTVDLTSYESDVTAATGTFTWYLDDTATTTVADATATSANDGDIFYVIFNDGTCQDTTNVRFTINPLPILTDLTPEICGTAPVNVDLTAYQTAITTATGTFTWYSDMAATTTVADATAASVNDADAFYVIFNDGTCQDTASVTFTINPLPVLTDLTSEICGTAPATVDLTTYEGDVTTATGTFAWYSDMAATTMVPDATAVSVNDADAFYVIFNDGTCQDTASVTFTINPLPVLTDLTPEICGTAPATVDLTTYQTAVTTATDGTFTWYSDATAATMVPDATAASVSNGDAFYVIYQDNTTTCQDTASVTFTINPLPTLIDLTPEICGTAPVNIDLTTYQTAVTTATDGTFTWYSDATAATMVPDATAVSVNDADAFYVIFNDGTCQDTASVTFTINPLPVLTDLTPEICGTAPATVDLTTYQAAITTATGTFAWYSDMAATTMVADATVVSVNTGDVFYAIFNDGTCQDTASVTFTINPLPTLTDLTPEICGTAPATVDLTTYQTAVTTATDGTFTWYSDATAATMVPDATAASVSNGDAFYVIYQDNTTTCQDTASVTFTINPLPTLTDLTPEICGTAPATVDLTTYQAAITTATGTFTWYSDMAATMMVPDATAVSVNDADVFYVIFNDGTCQDTASVTFTINPLPVLTDLTPEICGTAPATVDLTTYEGDITTDTGTFTWYSDMAATAMVPDATAVSVNDADVFYVIFNDGTCQDTASVTFTINPLPVLTDLTPEICGTAPATVDLTTYEGDITTDTGTFTWYSDMAATAMVPDATAVSVNDADVFYVIFSDGSCQDTASVTFTINPLPVLTDLTPEICGTAPITVDLTSYESDITTATGNFTWYSDATATMIVAIPTMANINDGDDFYVIFQDDVTSCQDTASVTFTIEPFPSLFFITVPICGAGTVNVDLTSYESEITTTTGTFTWYSDATATTLVPDATNVSASDADEFFVIFNNGNCADTSSLTINLKPLPILNDLTLAICGEAPVTVDLTTYEGDITTDAGTFNWYSNAAATTAVATPSMVNVNDGDAFYVIFSDGSCQDTASVTFTINPLPVLTPLTPELCGEAPVTVDLTTYQDSITTVAGNFTWYGDSNLVSTVSDPANVAVNTGATFYTIFVDATTGCQDTTNISFTVHAPTPTATLLPDTTICSTDQGSADNVFDLNDMITAGATTGTWSDDDASGALVGSIVTATAAMEGGTYNFTYTITGNTSGSGDACDDQSYTIQLSVENCNPVCPPKRCIPITITKRN